MSPLSPSAQRTCWIPAVPDPVGLAQFCGITVSVLVVSCQGSANAARQASVRVRMEGPLLCKAFDILTWRSRHCAARGLGPLQVGNAILTGF